VRFCGADFIGLLKLFEGFYDLVKVSGMSTFLPTLYMFIYFELYAMGNLKGIPDFVDIFFKILISQFYLRS